MTLRALFFAGGFVFLVLGLRAIHQGAETFPGGLTVLGLLPTYWVARLLESVRGQPFDVTAVWVLGLLTVALSVGWLVIAMREAKPPRLLRRGVRRLPWLFRLTTQPGADRATAAFVATMLLRDRQFRLRAVPLLVLPFAMGLLHELRADATGDAFFVVIEQFPAMYLPILMVFLPAADDWRGRWILDTAKDDWQGVRRGIGLGLLQVVVLPAMAVLLVLHAWLYDPLRAVLAVAFAGGVLMWSLPGVVQHLPAPPFTRSEEDRSGSADLGGNLGRALLLTAIALLFHATLDRVWLAAGIAAVVLVPGCRRALARGSYGGERFVEG
jgi:hypothetical protein